MVELMLPEPTLETWYPATLEMLSSSGTASTSCCTPRPMEYPVVWVLLEPWDAMVPPVAKMVIFGSEALMGVWMSWRMKSSCSPDLGRLMGEAAANEARSGRSWVKLFILGGGNLRPE